MDWLLSAAYFKLFGFPAVRAILKLEIGLVLA
jgi:hypothetical protein